MDDERLQLWDWVMLAFSLIALGVVAALFLLPLTADQRLILRAADTVVCGIFFSDFVRRLITARSRRRYLLRWGWIDFLASIPAVDALRAGRLIYILRFIRLLRALKSLRELRDICLKSPTAGTLATVSVLFFVVLLAGSLLILEVEDHPDAHIQTGGDALWWAIVTVTTVGYGDLYPVSPAGRLLAVALMLSGITLFGAFTAYLASLIKHERETERAKLGELQQMAERLERLERVVTAGAEAQAEAPKRDEAPAAPTPPARPA